MKSREPVLVRGRDYWDQINLPKSVFDSRIESIRKYMAENNLDLLLVYGRGDEDGDLCYVSNLVNKVPNWGLLVVISQDSVTVRNERSSRTRPVVERGTWIENLDFCDNVVKGLDEFFSVDDSNQTIGTVGFDSLPIQQRQRFEDEIGLCTTVRCDAFFQELRRIKTERELDQVARASRILGDVHESLADNMRDIPSEDKLWAQADWIARLRGARDFRFMISNPSQTEGHLRPAESHSIPNDQPIVLYSAGRFEGYWAERLRTYRLDGEQPYGEKYESTASVYSEYLDTMQAGVTGEELANKLQELNRDVNVNPAEIYTGGNGIGLGIHEQPEISEPDFELATGMTLSVQLAFEPENGSFLMFGDTIVVTENDSEILTTESMK